MRQVDDGKFVTNILTRAAVHEQLGSLLSINDPEVFVQRYVDAVREISGNGRYNSRPGAVLESLSEDVLYTLSQESVSVIQFYAAAKALYSAEGIFASQQFGAGAIGTSESQYVVALCLDATGVKVSDRLLRMAKQFFVINALRGRDVWTEFNADMTAIQEAFKVRSLTCYVSELLGAAHDYLTPTDAKEFPETGCKDFLESRGMAPFGVLHKFILGIETSNQSMTVFRRLVQVVGSLAHDLHASGAMDSPEFAEARQKMMAGILHLRSGKNGQNWRREDDDLMFELKGHVHEALPLKSIMTLARSIPLDQTNLADVDLTQIHGRLNVKNAVSRYVDPSEATVVIENAGISGLFSPEELRRFRGDKLEADLGM